jgi:hypothetical protein
MLARQPARIDPEARPRQTMQATPPRAKLQSQAQPKKKTTARAMSPPTVSLAMRTMPARMAAPASMLLGKTPALTMMAASVTPTAVKAGSRDALTAPIPP